MDRKLQKLILKTIADEKGVAEWNHIKSVVIINWWKDEVVNSEKHKTVVKHQLDLLEKEDKILRKDSLPDIHYIITPKGHLVLESWWKRTLNFVIYDKNNFFALMAVIISLASLVVSIIALKNQ